jgi:hypothetical protein
MIGTVDATIQLLSKCPDCMHARKQMKQKREAYVRLARIGYIRHIWPYNWSFPCQKYRIYTVYIYMVLANPVYIWCERCWFIDPT